MQNSTPEKGRAIIIGGSIGGLFSALFLRKAGWQVDVYERVPEEISSRGAGIVTHAPLFDALAQIDALPEGDVGVSVLGRRVFTPTGGIEGELSLPQVLTSWDRLYKLLFSRLPRDRYHQGKSLATVAQSAAKVTATFEDGSSATADLLIGADGHRSTVRSIFAPDIQPQYAGYVAWRGLVAEADVSEATRQAIFSHFTFSLPQHEQMLGYPVAGAGEDMRPGHLRYNYVWYRPADEGGTLQRLLTDKDGNSNGQSVAPTAIHPDVLNEMRADSARLLSPQFAELVAATKLPLIQPIYDVISQNLAFDRVVLLGDSAFVARPHCGMGVTKAAEDAAALFAAITQEPSLSSALARYEAERVPFGQRVVRHAQDLGAYMQAQITSPEARRAAELYRTPEAVMRETAVSTFLETQAA